MKETAELENQFSLSQAQKSAQKVILDSNDIKVKCVTLLNVSVK